MTRPNLGAAALLALAWLFFPCAAHAAESYDNCTGFITSLPTIITTQGTWCLKTDLTTAVTSGEAITINTNNVTIDCNNFKLGGLAAGPGTQTTGIAAINRVNVTIRNCSIRGFYFGLYFPSTTGGGHAIEDNFFEGNTFVAMDIEGDGSVVRRNRVFDTGSSTINSPPKGIVTSGSADVLDNTVSGVLATAGSNGSAFGIYTAFNPDGRIIGNGVRGLAKDGSGSSFGIYNISSNRLTMRDNDVIGDASTGSIGLRCNAAGLANTRDNVVSNFVTGLGSCTDDGGNLIKP